MAAIPEQERTTVRSIFDALAREAAAEPRRGHLGASVLGDECERKLWLGWRWCSDEEISGRLARLFRRGRLEEAQIVADLRAAGVTVYDTDEHGRQWSFAPQEFGGHVGGSMDAAGIGFVERPKSWCSIEFKTHNQKSFDDLVKNGLRKSKPQHFVQLALYLKWSGMRRGMYFAVCKNTDDIYSEVVRWEEGAREAAEEAEAKARRLLAAPDPPPGISTKPEFYKCKMCSAAAACHERRLPAPSCRTCVHATPERDGDARWSCALHERASLSLDEQRAGCADHVFIPALVPAEQMDASQPENWVSYKLPDGTLFYNGTRHPGSLDEPAFTSAELYAARDDLKGFLGDGLVQSLRADMGATLVPAGEAREVMEA